MDKTFEENNVPRDIVSATGGCFACQESAGRLMAVGMITGCGVMQVSNFYNYTSYRADKNYCNDVFTDESKAQLKADFAALITKITNRSGNAVRTLISTLGTRYLIAEPVLFELGFKLVDEYPNAAHPGMIQRLYTYTWERKREI